jgi:hypothetical protein
VSRFKTGADAAQKQSSVNFSRTQFFGIKDKETAIVRFLTEEPEWISVKQHTMVPTKSAPVGYKGDKWPQSMGCVCRKSTDADDQPFYDECFICDHMTKSDGSKYHAGGRTWALAVMREEVVENGEVVGYRDQTRTVSRKVNGVDKEVVEKAIVVVNMGWKNFFSIVAGFARHYKTLLDRDYKITRSGDDQTTTYSIIPLDPIPGYDLRQVDPKTDKPRIEAYSDVVDLADEVERRMSDEFYARFFDTRVTVTDTDGGGETKSTTSSTPAPSNDVDPSKLAALAEKVKGPLRQRCGDGTCTRGAAC